VYPTDGWVPLRAMASMLTTTCVFSRAEVGLSAAGAQESIAAFLEGCRFGLFCCCESTTASRSNSHNVAVSASSKISFLSGVRSANLAATVMDFSFTSDVKAVAKEDVELRQTACAFGDNKVSMAFSAEIDMHSLSSNTPVLTFLLPGSGDALFPEKDSPGENSE
jgi:hypothetical protein